MPGVYRARFGGARQPSARGVKLLSSSAVTAEFAVVLQAPFVRRQVMGRVSRVIDRYRALLDGTNRDRARIPVLFRFPSALRERDAVGLEVVSSRLHLAEEELRAIKAAAPIPAPDDRPDRLRIQALAEAQWLARELRALRRAVKAHPSAEGVELYFETRPDDPLPEPERLLSALATVPRGRLVNLAFELAGTRYGVSHLATWLVTAPGVQVGGPVCAGSLGSLPEGKGRRVMVRDRPVAVFRIGDEVKAVAALCPHRGGSLDEGEVTGGAVYCPLHEWAFDLGTGCMIDRPTVRIDTYRVEIRDGEIWVHPPGES